MQKRYDEKEAFKPTHDDSKPVKNKPPASASPSLTLHNSDLISREVPPKYLFGKTVHLNIYACLPPFTLPVPHPSPPPLLRWLFLDLNSYFASVEQQVDERLRGRPVAVVPVMTDYTCAIAASREAKQFGVKTGTMIGDAKKMCPGLVLVLARHDLYVEFHHKIINEVERHFPVHAVCSIDEVALKLDPPRQPQDKALDLARRIKAGLRKNIGEITTCSIGLAPNRFLGKVASDLKKPDGLEVIHMHDMPGRLQHLDLRDLPGIGRNMEPRLQRENIYTFLDLWNATPQMLHAAWGGVGGDRFWQQLHGGELDDLPTERRTIGHSHVLAPEFRRPEAAAIVAKRLVLKAASRMRRLQYRATEMSVSVRAEDRSRGEAHLRFPAVSDSFALVRIMDQLWLDCLQQTGPVRMKKISVTLHGLESWDAPEQLDLFPELGSPVAASKDRRERLSKIMDDLNQHYGRDSIALGFLPDAVKTFSGTKIAFTRIPSLEEFKE